MMIAEKKKKRLFPLSIDFFKAEIKKREDFPFADEGSDKTILILMVALY